MVDFDVWYTNGDVARAMAGSEHGTEQDQAHEQLNIDFLTSLPQTVLPAEQHESARRMTGTARKDKLQAIRNKEEEALIKWIKTFMKANSPAWLFEDCVMNMKVNICNPEDDDRTPGYTLKERHEAYWTGALLGYMPHLRACGKHLTMRSEQAPHASVCASSNLAARTL